MKIIRLLVQILFIVLIINICSCSTRTPYALNTNILSESIKTKIPDLSSIPNTPAINRQTSGDFKKYGSDYYLYKSKNANVSMTDMLLPGVEPDWALYRFGEFPITDTLQTLSIKLQDSANCWIGLSDYKHNGWSWVECKGTDNYQIDLSKYNSLINNSYVFYFIVVAKGEKVQLSWSSILTAGGTTSNQQGIYSMFGVNQYRRGLMRSVGPLVKPIQKWSFPAGPGEIKAIPVIDAQGTLYFGGGTTFYAVNPVGTEKWHYHCRGSLDSTAAIDTDGTIYVAGYDQYVYAFNSDGSLKWETKLNGYGYASVCLTKDNRLYIGMQGGKSLYSIKKSDGMMIWGDALAGLSTTRFSSPAVDRNGNVYIGGASKLFSLKSDKTYNWVLYDPGGSSYGGTDYSPVVGDYGTIYVFGTYKTNGCLWAINPDGTEQWHYPLNNQGVDSVTIAPDGALCFAAWNASINKIVVYQIYPDKTTKSALEIDVPDDTYRPSTNVSVDQNGNMFFGTTPGRIYALDSIANVIWTYDTGENIDRSAPILDVNGNMYFGTLKGNLIALSPK